MSHEQKIKLPMERVLEDVTGEVKSFPKYTTQLMNLANQNSQGTRPAVVGQLSELISEVPHRTYEGWEEWYLKRHPESIQKAVNKIKPMLENFRKALDLIDEEMISDWVEDLVLTKTAEGLIFQEKILEHIASLRDEKWRIANPEEESQNIDGYIGGKPVQIKPKSYQSKKSSVRETIEENIEIIYYSKTAKYLTVYLENGENPKLSLFDE